MSLDATRWAWQQFIPHSTDKLVLLSLADRANEAHQCYPSIIRLAADTGCNRKTVMEAIRRLEELGLIEANKAWGKGTVYQLVGVTDRHGNQYQKRDQSQIRDQSQKRDGTSPKNGTGPVPKTGHEPINNQSRTDQEGKKPKKRFLPPTVEEIAAYCLERKNGIDPELFHAHYDSVGWKTKGGSKLESWKSAVITWEKRNAGNGRGNGSTGPVRIPTGNDMPSLTELGRICKDAGIPGDQLRGRQPDEIRSMLRERGIGQ